MDRRDMGTTLLKWFLKDGKIRGVDGDGQIYAHTVDGDLVGRFIQGIES